jgi:hypothetical protein
MHQVYGDSSMVVALLPRSATWPPLSSAAPSNLSRPPHTRRASKTPALSVRLPTPAEESPLRRRHQRPRRPERIVSGSPVQSNHDSKQSFEVIPHNLASTSFSVGYLPQRFGVWQHRAGMCLCWSDLGLNLCRRAYVWCPESNVLGMHPLYLLHFTNLGLWWLVRRPLGFPWSIPATDSGVILYLHKLSCLWHNLGLDHSWVSLVEYLVLQCWCRVLDRYMVYLLSEHDLLLGMIGSLNIVCLW